MYHKISPDSPTMWWVSVDDFYRQMSEISKKEIVYLDDYNPENKNHVVITFDGVYKNVLDYALPIMKKFNFPFELFITSDYIGLSNEFDSVEPYAVFANNAELKELIDGGGRLQWHTKRHLNLKEVIDRDLLIDELQIPLEVKLIDSRGFNWFAYPHGEFNDIVVNLVRLKFKGAVSCNQGNDNDIFKLNRLTVINNTSLRENKIACIIASYNYGAYLIEAIESVLRQTIVPNEILITDDCSDDETQIIAEDYVKKYPKLIKYNRNEVNLGIVNNFNKAIALTDSEYVFFLGADNRIKSNYVEECARVLDKDENMAIAYTDYAFFGPRAKLAYDEFPKEKKGRIINNVFYQITFPDINEKEELLKEINKKNFMHGSSMYRRTYFNEVGGYKETKKAEDYNLFKRILEKGWSARKVSNTVLEYRKHSLGQANTILSIQNRMLFYKRGFIMKSAFERSNIYKQTFRLYKALTFVKRNYKRPKKIVSKIWSKIK